MDNMSRIMKKGHMRQSKKRSPICPLYLLPESVTPTVAFASAFQSSVRERSLYLKVSPENGSFSGLLRRSSPFGGESLPFPSAGLIHFSYGQIIAHLLNFVNSFFYCRITFVYHFVHPADKCVCGRCCGCLQAFSGVVSVDVQPKATAAGRSASRCVCTLACRRYLYTTISMPPPI